ncbi:MULTISPECIES: diguanylate cyclase [unclassified Neptuniibacter]|uniref:diguanylate cyclase n=1 Tax=uncultured Neptuniibacter sp. TaxID=502143 RepID=UPI0025EF4A62|nr:MULTISPECIES: diguanylate cyclase [unclassified Neptuniibacter]
MLLERDSQKNEAYTSIFENKKPFRGFVDIIGVNYFTAYDPILDSEKNVIGILYVGRETESYFSPIQKVELSISLIVLISAILGAFLTFLSSRLIISKAHIDSLTRVLNRKVGEESLQKALVRTFENRNKLSIAFIDLDGFKAVNDKFGYVVGDEVLKSIAKVLKCVVRKSDHLVRWGGDEFLMIFEETSKDEAYEILKRVIEDQSILPKLPDDSIQTLSIGIAGVDRHDELIDIDQLVTAADYMMYQSKNGGRNQISM